VRVHASKEPPASMAKVLVHSYPASRSTLPAVGRCRFSAPRRRQSSSFHRVSRRPWKKKFRSTRRIELISKNRSVEWRDTCLTPLDIERYNLISVVVIFANEYLLNRELCFYYYLIMNIEYVNSVNISYFCGWQDCDLRVVSHTNMTIVWQFNSKRKEICIRKAFEKKQLSPITYHWTVPIILDHSYLVGKLKGSKIADKKVSGF
jgi:hypothetical protein